jgi:endo-1,4-beta-D-glucanase Y
MSCKKETSKPQMAFQANRSFPQAINYPGCIKPNHVNQADLNAAVVGYYNYWKLTYLKNNLSSLPGGYYVNGEILGDPEGFIALGCSEGLGYGMIISVLMAGYDVNAQICFNGLYKTSRTFHSAKNSHLMGWVVADHPNAQGHFSSATDGDMDIAYALLLAHYQWGSDGKINYLNEALDIINKGLKVSNVTTGNRLNLGDWDAKDALNTRPSDWMMDHMRVFYQETGDIVWLQVINNLYSVYDQFSSKYSVSTYLISDFVINNPAEPAPKNFLNEFPPTDSYYYNASRVPLRMVMDYALYGSAEGYRISNKLVNWVKAKTGGDPSKIVDGYYLNGDALGNDTAMAFTASLVAASVANSNNQDFLNKGWDYMKNRRNTYFNDTYNLLCMLFVSGNWWKPTIL